MTDHWNDRLFMTREQMREYDRIAIEEIGIPGPVLMENAGRNAAEVAMEILGDHNTVAVVTGPGNNGGDGYVIARHLINEGYHVSIYRAVSPDKITGDALVNYKILEAMNAPIFDISTAQGSANLAKQLFADGFIVDALLGTGVTRAVEGHIGNIIDAVNDAGVTVMSVDIPSGLDANTGTSWGKMVNADATVTFGHFKRGLLLYPGADAAGTVNVASIGVPGHVSGQAGFDGEIISEELIVQHIPKRRADSHKGTFGHLIVLAGSLGKTGSAVLTSRAAMRVGTGLVTIATTANAQPIIESKCLEVMVSSIMEKADAPLTDKVLKHIGSILEGKRAVALGPGLSTAPGISALVMRFLQMTEVPAVIDADGLNILANDPTQTGRIKAPMIFTPHPGEMARLMNKSVPAVQANRVGISREAAKRYKVVIVLKGARTVIASPDGQVFINPTGNPGMASGGMGDVLTGIIGGLLAQDLEPLEAALLGTYLHGHSGDLAAEEIGEPSLLASDLLDNLPGILKDWSNSSK